MYSDPNGLKGEELVPKWAIPSLLGLVAAKIEGKLNSDEFQPALEDLTKRARAPSA